MTIQNDHLEKGKRDTLDNQLRYEDETTSGKGKRATSNNQFRHEDEENDVKRMISPKTLHKDLNEFRINRGETVDTTTYKSS